MLARRCRSFVLQLPWPLLPSSSLDGQEACRTSAMEDFIAAPDEVSCYTLCGTVLRGWRRRSVRSLVGRSIPMPCFSIARRHPVGC